MIDTPTLQPEKCAIWIDLERVDGGTISGAFIEGRAAPPLSSVDASEQRGTFDDAELRRVAIEATPDLPFPASKAYVRAVLRAYGAVEVS